MCVKKEPAELFETNPAGFGVGASRCDARTPQRGVLRYKLDLHPMNLRKVKSGLRFRRPLDVFFNLISRLGCQSRGRCRFYGGCLGGRRRRRRVRAGVAGRGVNDDSRVLVIAHEFGVGGRELPNQAVENFRQRFVRRVKLVAQFLRHGLAGDDVVARFGGDGFEGVNGRLQRGQLGRRNAVSREAGNVGVGEIMDVLAILDDVRVAFAGQVGNGKIRFVGQRVVLVFDSVGVNRRTDLLRCRCHRRLGRFFVLRDAGGIRHLGKFQGLDSGYMAGEVRVSIRESLQRLPDGIVGIEHAFDGQIHGQLVLLFRVHV